MNTSRLRLAFLATSVLFTGCDFVRPSAPLQVGGDRLAVYSVLQAGAPRAAVLVVRFRHDVPAFEPGWDAVPGAAVSLLTPQGTLRLTADTANAALCGAPVGAGSPPPAVGEGCYTAIVPGGIRAGASYGLRVDVPGGERVTGEATVPEPLRILSPAPGEAIPVYSREIGNAAVVPLRWAGTGTPARLEAGIAPGSDECLVPVEPRPKNGNFTVLNVAHGDSASLIVSDARCERDARPLTWSSIPATVSLTVYDSAYAAYAQTLGNDAVEEPRASAGLKGALGVFAGAAKAVASITFVHATRP